MSISVNSQNKTLSFKGITKLIGPNSAAKQYIKQQIPNSYIKGSDSSLTTHIVLYGKHLQEFYKIKGGIEIPDVLLWGTDREKAEYQIEHLYAMHDMCIRRKKFISSVDYSEKVDSYVAEKEAAGEIKTVRL